MKFYQLAFQYLKRKKSKTVLLFLVLLFVSSMILSTSMILRATQDSKSAIQEKTNAKIVIDILDNDQKITKNDIKQINNLNEVVTVNRLAADSAFPDNFSPVTNSDSVKEDNLKISLLSYDNLENDSAFFEKRYRLDSGKLLDENTTNGIVINSILADTNGMKIGDMMSFETADGKTTDVKIIGLFSSGSERKQSATMSSEQRIENQVFIDNHSYSNLYEDSGFYKVAVYTKSPEQIETLSTKLKSILQNKAELTTSDTLYKQLEAPLEQIIRVTKLMLILTFITGTVVVSLLLCMWMRTRQKETAIFISMGKAKSSIYLQVFLESLIVFIISVIGACGLGSCIANVLQSLLTSSETSEVTLHVFLQMKDIDSLLGMGGLVVLIAVTCSLVPILKANPKDTLSKMEG